VRPSIRVVADRWKVERRFSTKFRPNNPPQPVERRRLAAWRPLTAAQPRGAATDRRSQPRGAATDRRSTARRGHLPPLNRAARPLTDAQPRGVATCRRSTARRGHLPTLNRAARPLTAAQPRGAATYRRSQPRGAATCRRSTARRAAGRLLPSRCTPTSRSAFVTAADSQKIQKYLASLRLGELGAELLQPSAGANAGGGSERRRSARARSTPGTATAALARMAHVAVTPGFPSSWPRAKPAAPRA
jgi:hypothetical protein